MITSPNELITIGIPVYNMEGSILEAIQSCLNQSYQNIEILIVNDGSTDSSIDTIKKNISDPRVRIYERDQNGGVCLAMRDLVNQARGKYICFLDADDTMMSSRVEEQYEAIKSAECRYPTKMVASFCGSLVNDITSNTKYTIHPSDLWNYHAKHGFGGGTGHSMYRVSDLKKLGNFDIRFSRSADSAMCLMFLMNGGFYAMVDKPLITYNFLFDKSKKHNSKKEWQIFKQLRNEIAVENPRNLYLQRFLNLSCNQITLVKLWGIIPLLKIKKKGPLTKVYLFGFIPSLTFLKW